MTTHPPQKLNPASGTFLIAGTLLLPTGIGYAFFNWHTGLRLFVVGLAAFGFGVLIEIAARALRDSREASEEADKIKLQVERAAMKARELRAEILHASTVWENIAIYQTANDAQRDSNDIVLVECLRKILNAAGMYPTQFSNKGEDMSWER